MISRPSWWRPRDRLGRFTTLGRGNVRDDQIAEALVEEMSNQAEEAFESVIAEIIVRAKADVPVGDPALDPDPAISLRESFIVYWVGNTATIAVVADYAVKQHEATHYKHPRGGGAKFLEKHMLGAGPEIQKALGHISLSRTGPG